MYDPVAARKVWEEALTLVQKQVSEKDFQTWIVDLGARTFDNGVLTLEAPFGLFRDRIKSAFLPALEESVSKVVGYACAIVIEVGTVSRPSTTHSKTVSRIGATPVHVATPPKGRERVRTFDDFVVGESNKVAYLGARQLAEGETHEGGNPLFLHGGVGLGKTHLLRAIQHSLRSRGKRVLYYQGEDFTRRMVEALQRGKMEAFHREIRGADALLIDDVQFLAGKKRTQQELYHAFNLLHQAGKPVGMASDRPPEEIENLDKGLQSRFGGGLLVETEALDHDLRLRLIKAKLVGAAVQLDSFVLEKLAGQLQGSVREIEGLVSRLRAAGSDGSVPLDNNTVETMITPYLSRRGPVDLEVVIETVAWVHGLTREELLSRDRSQRVSWPRNVASYLCRKSTSASLPEIGEAMGGRNHTSILRAVRTVNERQQDDEQLANKLAQLERMLGNPLPRRREKCA